MTEERLKQIEQALTVGGPFGSDPTFAKATVRDLVAEVRRLQRVAEGRLRAVQTLDEEEERLRVLAAAAVEAAEIVRQWHANPRPAVHWKPFLEAVDAYRAAGQVPEEEPCSDAYVAGLLAEVRRMRDRELASTIYETSRKAEGGAASPMVVEVRQEGNPLPGFADFQRPAEIRQVEDAEGNPLSEFEWAPASSASRKPSPPVMETPREARELEGLQRRVGEAEGAHNSLVGRVALLEAWLARDEEDEGAVLRSLSEMQATFLRRFEAIEAENEVVSRYVSGLTARVDALESQEAAPYGRAEFDDLKQRQENLNACMMRVGRRLSDVEDRLTGLEEAEASSALPEDDQEALLARVRAFLCAVNAERVAMPPVLLDEAKALREALG